MIVKDILLKMHKDDPNNSRRNVRNDFS